MGNVINSKSQFDNLLSTISDEWLYQIANNIKEKYIEEFLESEFYDLYTPKSYVRTRKILDNIVSTKVHKIGKSRMIEIYLDDSSATSYLGDIFQETAGYPPTDGEPAKVWENMNEGWHGFAAKTDGHFWNELVEQLGVGGKYDLFKNFRQFVKLKGFAKVI